MPKCEPVTRRPIEALWESYKSAVIPKAAGPVQIEECRRAFYAGAGAMSREFARIGYLNDLALESAELDHIKADMDEFLKSLREGGKCGL